MPEGQEKQVVDEVQGADSTATFEPVQKLEVVDESKLESQIEYVYQQRCLLYLFKKDSNSWVTRGKGDIKIVQNKESKKTHMAMHTEKTLRTCLNCLLFPSMTLTANSGSDRSWIFNTVDFADFDEPGVAKTEIFLVKFKTTEIQCEPCLLTAVVPLSCFLQIGKDVVMKEAPNAALFKLTPAEEKARSERTAKREAKAGRKAKKEAKYEAGAEARAAASDRANRQLAAVRRSKADVRAKHDADRLKARGKSSLKKQSAKNPELQEAGLDKLHELQTLTAASSDGIISMNEDQYMRYVNDGPRPYYIMLSYTALAPQNRCSMCAIVHKATSTLADSYRASHGYLVDDMVEHVKAGRYDVSDGVVKPVFFVELDIQNARDVFTSLKMNSAPTVMMVPPKLSAKKVEQRKFLDKMPAKYKYNIVSENIEAEDIKNFVSKLAHVNIDIVTPIPWGFIMFLSLSGIAAAGFMYYYLEKLLPWIRKKKDSFFYMSVIFYLFCVSGGMYNIIRNTPFSVPGQDGEVNYIADGQRNQYGAEGYMAGMMMTGCGLVIVAMVVNAFEPLKQSDKKWYHKVGILFSPIVLVAAFVLFWYFLASLYTRKNWGWNYGFVWR